MSSRANGRMAAHDDRVPEVLELGAAPGFPIVAEIAVRNGPISGIATSPDGTRVLVTNYGRDSVSVIDTDTCRVVHTIAGLGEPFAIAMGSEDAERAYVSTVSTAYDSIAVIDVPTYTVVATHPLALSVGDLAVSPDGRHVYTSRNGARGADVAALDTATGEVEALEVATAPGNTTACVRVSPDGARLYVGANGPTGGRLVVIGTRGRSRSKAGQAGLRVVGTIDIGLPVRDVALSPNGAVAYVASCEPELGAVVDVVDTATNKIVGTRKLGEIGGVLTGLTLSRDGDRAYLVSDDGIAVLCTLTHDVVGTVTVTDQPSCMVESPDAKYLYIADYSGAVTVAAVASIVALGTESTAPETQVPTDWVTPELLQPALA
ncbi:YncE family protein [Mycobacterium sp. 663a-19]|uniref:YncE family protein n=1 Tax=Mycobacterium sp. 663a-19 TaxID=2986148 RepID=UPI002D1F3D13|nr:YncE family protein [Mycobacterium sp. 663a-19]MEB3980408.1 YncE family protein [Mycobacterium sp. 663a-19]